MHTCPQQPKKAPDLICALCSCVCPQFTCLISPVLPSTKKLRKSITRNSHPEKKMCSINFFTFYSAQFSGSKEIPPLPRLLLSTSSWNFLTLLPREITGLAVWNTLIEQGLIWLNLHVSQLSSGLHCNGVRYN